MILFLICAFYSCSSDNPAGADEFTSGYFPLAVGNKWVYTINNEEFSIEIRGRRTIGNYEYFAAVRSENGSPDTSFYRIAENNNVIIRYGDNDYYYIKFNETAGVEWESYSRFYGKIRNRNLSMKVDAGNFSNIIEVFWDNREVSDLTEFKFYAPGIGLIKSEGFRRIFELKSAVINGIEYP